MLESAHGHDLLVLLKINLQQSLDRISCPANSADEGNTRRRRFRWCLIPQSSWLVHRDVIPDYRSTVAFAKRTRYEMFLVPVLRHSQVREAPQSEGRRRTQIGRQYGFPHYEHQYSWIVLSSEQFFECRGPLQADRSSRGEHHEQSDGICRSVECVL